jgi:uncharacterized protein with GYD domain
MAKYLIKATYGPEGVKGLLKEGGTGRRKAVDQLVAGLGGKVEAFYYALGDEDVFVIADLPDNTAAAAISLAVNATGAVQLKTVPLLAVEDIDEAAKKTAEYRPPGG